MGSQYLSKEVNSYHVGSRRSYNNLRRTITYNCLLISKFLFVANSTLFIHSIPRQSLIWLFTLSPRTNFFLHLYHTGSMVCITSQPYLVLNQPLSMDELAKRLCFVHNKTYSQTFCRVDMTHQHRRSNQSQKETLSSPTTSFDTIQDWMLFTNHIVPLLDSHNCFELNLTMTIPPASIISRMPQDLRRKLEIQIGSLISSLSYIRGLQSLSIRITPADNHSNDSLGFIGNCPASVQLCLGHMYHLSLETFSLSVNCPNCHTRFQSIVTPSLVSFVTHFTFRCQNNRTCGSEPLTDFSECHANNPLDECVVQGLFYMVEEETGTFWDFETTSPGIFRALPAFFSQMEEQYLGNLNHVTIHCDHVVDVTPRFDIIYPVNWCFMSS